MLFLVKIKFEVRRYIDYIFFEFKEFVYLKNVLIQIEKNKNKFFNGKWVLLNFIIYLNQVVFMFLKKEV